MANYIKMRESFYLRWSWWLLLLTFALTFFLTDSKVAKNLYRVLVALPVLLMLSAPMLKGFFVSKPMRWFAAVTLYFLISLFWGVEFQDFDNHLLRILAVWGLAFLLYYIYFSRPDLFAKIDSVLVGFGFIWIVLVLVDWGSVWQPHPQFDIWMVKRGVFSHHLQVGWMVAALTLISLQHIFKRGSNSFLWILPTVLFFALLILVQARGGMVVFATGLILWLIINLRRLNMRLFVALAIVVMCVLGGIQLFYPDLYASLMARGTASRFAIWQNWYTAWKTSAVAVIFGHGLGASTENIHNNFTAAHFHSLYLNTLYYGGVVGFGMVLAWFCSVVRSILEKKMLSSPWTPVAAGMLAGFLTDGDNLFNYPGAFVFCFLLPVFCLSWLPEGPHDKKG